MYKFAAQVGYFGGTYCGWQRQSKEASGPAQSVQEVIEEALRTITEEKVNIIGSGRTDAGVHATGQVFHFVLRKRDFEPRILLNALNARLPEKIRISGVTRVRPEFHAQKSALKKRYAYYFQEGPSSLVPYVPFTTWTKGYLDLEAMQAAAKVLVGEHDFKAFQATGTKVIGTIRTLFDVQIVRWQAPFFIAPHFFNPADASPFFKHIGPQNVSSIGPTAHAYSYIRLSCLGSGFLRSMVRGIAGTLLQIGKGKRPSTDMIKILESRDRTLVGPSAPAHGLWLEEVHYPADFFL